MRNEIPAYVYNADGSPSKHKINVPCMLSLGYTDKNVQDIVYINQDDNVGDTIRVSDVAYVVEAKDEGLALVRRLWW